MARVIPSRTASSSEGTAVALLGTIALAVAGVVLMLAGSELLPLLQAASVPAIALF